jgi:hypothetical protein
LSAILKRWKVRFLHLGIVIGFEALVEDIGADHFGGSLLQEGAPDALHLLSLSPSSSLDRELDQAEVLGCAHSGGLGDGSLCMI